MKRFIKTAFASLLLLCAFSAGAQNKDKQEARQEWKEKVMSEKIAFITTKLSLTPEDAKAFWPVYNQVSQKRDKVFFEVRKTYREMENTLKTGDEKEISKALDRYVKALNASKTVETEALASYRKVLSDVKIAKLYQAEEQFRFQQINRLHQKPSTGREGNSSDHSHKPKPSSGQKPEKND